MDKNHKMCVSAWHVWVEAGLLCLWQIVMPAEISPVSRGHSRTKTAFHTHSSAHAKLTGHYQCVFVCVLQTRGTKWVRKERVDKPCNSWTSRRQQSFCLCMFRYTRATIVIKIYSFFSTHRLSAQRNTVYICTGISVSSLSGEDRSLSFIECYSEHSNQYSFESTLEISQTETTNTNQTLLNNRSPKRPFVKK